MTAIVQRELTVATAEHEFATTNLCKLATNLCKLTTSREHAATRHKVAIANQEQAAAEYMHTTTKHRVATTKHELATTEYECEPTTTKRKFINVGRELAMAEHELAAAEHELVTAKCELATAEHELAAAEQGIATTERDITVTQHGYKLATTQDNDARVRYIAAKAKANAMATTPYDLAMDCLQLSMHFFYPIQHCAQQVYHSALPLSPATSQLRKSHLQSIMDCQLSNVTAFSSPPQNWGLLLRTIDVRPKQLTCIATSIQSIIAACDKTVDIYDIVAGVLQQSLHAQERVERIHNTPDGTILFFVHSFSLTMWDVQTGGLIHTLATKSGINDVAVSTAGDHIACGMSDGSVRFWDINTKESAGFGNGEPVVTISWVSPQEVAVATQRSLYVHNIVHGYTVTMLPIPGHVWGMVYLKDKGEFLVGTRSPEGTHQERYTFKSIKYRSWQLCQPEGRGSTIRPEQLTQPTLVGDRVVCMASPSGVRWLTVAIGHCGWAQGPPLLDGARSVAVSLDKNLVVQMKDSIQIFSLDVLTSHKASNDVPPPHVYPLWEDCIVCLQQSGHLTLLELETMGKLSPDDNSFSLKSLLTKQSASAPASSGCGLIGEFGASTVKHAWQFGTPLSMWPGMDEEVPLGKLSPGHTRIVSVYNSPQKELQVKDVKHGQVAHTPLEHSDLRTGKVYDLTFDSESRFYIKVEGPG